MNAFFRYAAIAALLVGVRAGARADAASEITAADTAYNVLASQEGMYKATLAYAAPDAVFLGYAAAHLTGPSAIAKVWGSLPPGATITWKVETATAAASGDLGYTTGAYFYRQPRPGQTDAVQHGHYCTIWRRQPDGTWKFALDTGEADKP